MSTLTQTPDLCWQGRPALPSLPPSLRLTRYPAILWRRYRRWSDLRALESLPFDLRKDLGWPAADDC